MSFMCGGRVQVGQLDCTAAYVAMIATVVAEFSR